MVYFLILVIIILISVSFYRLFERKNLRLIHIRQGPNIIGYVGILQPFRDAIKLFCNEIITPIRSNYYLFFITPILAVFRALGTWIILPYSAGVISLKYCVLLFFIFTTIGVYSHLGAGWRSNSNYALVGRLRSIAQRVSYEVRFAFLLILIMFLVLKFNLIYSHMVQREIYLLFVVPLVSGIWLLSSLAETNRSPFDFAEGESELVSGFNIEYGRTRFALLFIGEYSRIIFISILFGTLFFGGQRLEYTRWGIGVIIIFFFVWIRGTLPRRRYDKLIRICWFNILPARIFLILILIMLY